VLPGPIGTIVAKWIGLGAAAKAATATAAGITTLIIAGGAAGILPGTVEHVVATSPQVTTNISASAQGTGTSSEIGTTGSVSPSGTTVNATTSSHTTTPSTSSATNALNNLGGGIPDLGDLPVEVPDCVEDILDEGAGADPTAILNQIPDCIDDVLEGLPELPIDIKKCVKSVLKLATSAASTATSGGLPITELDLGTCLPFDTTKCMTSALSVANAVHTSGGGSAGFSGFGSIPFFGRGGFDFGAGGIPGLDMIGNLDELAGDCMPFDVHKCLKSVLGDLPLNGEIGDLDDIDSIEDLDLSNCVPTGAIPGMSMIPGLGSIPGLEILQGFTGFTGFPGFGR